MKKRVYQRWIPSTSNMGLFETTFDKGFQLLAVPAMNSILDVDLERDPGSPSKQINK